MAAIASPVVFADTEAPLRRWDERVHRRQPILRRARLPEPSTPFEWPIPQRGSSVVVRRRHFAYAAGRISYGQQGSTTPGDELFPDVAERGEPPPVQSSPSHLLRTFRAPT